MSSSRYDKEEIKFRVEKNKVMRKVEQIRRKQELRDLKKSVKKQKHIQFTKIALFAICFFVILNCTAVELYSAWVMFYMRDISALYALISAVVAESLTLLGTFIGYLWKSYSETREEAKINLERDKLSLEYDSFVENRNGTTNDEIPVG